MTVWWNQRLFCFLRPSAIFNGLWQFYNRTTIMSQKLGASWSLFQGTTKVSEVLRQGERTHKLQVKFTSSKVGWRLRGISFTLQFMIQELFPLSEPFPAIGVWAPKHELLTLVLQTRAFLLLHESYLLGSCLCFCSTFSALGQNAFNLFHKQAPIFFYPQTLSPSQKLSLTMKF